MSPSHRPQGLATRAVHAGEPRPPIADAVAMPIFQTSTFQSGADREYHDIRYMRLSNTPNHRAVAAKIAALEGTETALVTASGMAAVTTTLLAHLKQGDHVIAQACLYGGTLDFLRDHGPELGIEVTFVSLEDPAAWERALRPTTRVFYVESITNPLMEVGRLDAAATFARERGLVSMIDNTFATPVNFRPAELGYELVLHSGTKYLNGHSDVIAGVVAGRADRVERIRQHLNLLGGSLDAFSCYLLQRGLKTLPLRVERQNENALALAEALASHAGVRAVHHPGLEENPSHRRAAEWFTGSGGMLSFLPDGDVARSRRICQSLTVALNAPSLGGVESLVSQPATSSHAGLTAEQRQAIGIDEALVRVSVGIEDPEDLVADFVAALENV